MRDDDDEKLFPVFGEMKGGRAGVELRETAFNLWMGCYSQDEIAEVVGFSRQAIGEFLNSLQDARNGTDAKNGDLSENPVLTSEPDREFDDDDQDDGSSLGVYKLDKRLLIKANHLDEHFTPPIYNVWKQQERSNRSATGSTRH